MYCGLCVCWEDLPIKTKFLFSEVKSVFITFAYLTLCCDFGAAKHRLKTKTKTDHQVSIPITLQRVNNAKHGVRTADIILNALISDHSFAHFIAILLSVLLSL